MTEEQQNESGDEDVVDAHDDAPAEETAPGEEAAADPVDEVDEVDVSDPADEVGETVGTGHPAVDEVLRSLDALGEAPVDEHVAVFEQAHEQLRRTLQGAGDE